MAHLHVSTARQSTRLGQSVESASHDPLEPNAVNDLWISDLTNDLFCFGLCDLEPGAADGVDELALLSLTSDVAEGAGMVARTRHAELGL
jgi:hypothetical protein